MRIFGKLIVPATLFTGLLALSACGGVKTSAADVNSPLTPEGSTPAQADNSGGLSWMVGKNSSSSGQAAQIQVNAYLWRATLDTLSFMPMVSADPFGGVIITDWYTPPTTPGERFKVNAYILSKQITADSVQVSVFHQVQTGNGWADAPADPDVASGLEDRILARAADLQAAASNAAQ